MKKHTHIQAGAAFHCPHCQNDSIAKCSKEYEGFSLKREYLACALCQAEIAAPATDCGTETKAEPSALQALFADNHTADKQNVGELLEDDGQRRFCKNCLHNFFTAFKCFCNLHQKEVEPLHDCPDFSPKKRLSSL